VSGFYASTYADPGYQPDGRKRYPLNSEKRVRAAWAYINRPANAAKYTAGQVALIHTRIRGAGRRYGIEFGHARTRKLSAAQGGGGWKGLAQRSEAIRTGRWPKSPKPKPKGQKRRRLVHPNRAHKHRTASGMRSCSKRG
jgi:hypothetical protein